MKVLFSSGLLLAALLPSAVLGAHPKDLLSRTQREAGNHPDRVLQTANLTVADLPGPSAICNGQNDTTDVIDDVSPSCPLKRCAARGVELPVNYTGLPATGYEAFVTGKLPFPVNKQDVDAACAGNAGNACSAVCESLGIKYVNDTQCEAGQSGPSRGNCTAGDLKCQGLDPRQPLQNCTRQVCTGPPNKQSCSLVEEPCYKSWTEVCEKLTGEKLRCISCVPLDACVTEDPTDTDQDGIKNDCDNCPHIANPEQQSITPLDPNGSPNCDIDVCAHVSRGDGFNASCTKNCGSGNTGVSDAERTYACHDLCTSLGMPFLSVLQCCNAGGIPTKDINGNPHYWYGKEWMGTTDPLTNRTTYSYNNACKVAYAADKQTPEIAAANTNCCKCVPFEALLDKQGNLKGGCGQFDLNKNK